MPALRRELHYGDRVVSCFADRPPHVHAMLAEAVAARPDAQAVICGETRLTYAALDAEVRALAAGLAARGIGPGDRVALLLGNGVPFVAMTHAVARRGAILVPLSVRDQTPGLRHALADSGAKLLVADAGPAALVPGCDQTPDLAHRFAVGDAPGFEPFGALGRDPASAPAAAEPEEDAPAAILYTSGTTGLPKGAVLTNLGIVHSASAYAAFMKLGPQDRGAVVVPLSHVTGLVACLHATVRAGGALIVEREFKAARFLETAARERVSFTVMVPAMYNLFLVQDDPARHDLSAWRFGGFGGAPMPAATLERLAELLPGLSLMNCYGATETTSPVTMMPPAETAARRLSVGPPSPGAEIAVMDDDGREVPPGEHGELWHRGPMVVPGYWNNPQATAREFTAGFWKSGDIGSKDADGFVYVHDRKKDMINRGGYKIFSAQVENVLQAVPGVLESAVIARPCPVLGERVHAVIVTDGSLDRAALDAHCRRELADYQRPESWTIRSEPLPRNANGKIIKRRIKAELDEAAGAL
ncbi:MAG TPA: class I adenylate-forming enzyme family protein [Paracoccaceae bacterium]|nr:class I adenylate-forming enzyme family protein [Paracoccaceae bacterium]